MMLGSYLYLQAPRHKALRGARYIESSCQSLQPLDSSSESIQLLLVVQLDGGMLELELAGLHYGKLLQTTPGCIIHWLTVVSNIRNS